MPKEIEIIPTYFDHVLSNKYPVNIIVGGRASGKTFFMEQLTAINLNNCKGYKLLVVEDVETNIGAGVKDGIQERIDEFGHEQFYKSTKIPPEISHNITNNNVIFKGYHSEKQQKQVKSLNEVTAAWYEEGENITFNQFKALRMQLRGGDPKDRQLFITMNPINPDSYINNTFFKTKPDEVFETFEDGRPKVFVKNINVELVDKEVIIPCLVVVTTHWDNPYLTDEQRADIEDLKNTDIDLWHMLAEGKFIYPKGALLTKRNDYSLSKFIIEQAARLTAVVDTASSGSDSATLAIYAKVDEEHHYLIDCIKDDNDADQVIPRMTTMINKYKPQKVYIEKNHEGLYYESEIKRGISKGILVSKFHSSENKHEKILGQSGRMVEHLYIRDDADREYKSFVSEMYSYNKDKKKNDHDDCIDNVAMYFKHGNKTGMKFG